jgi:hypothetical protein
MSQRDPFLVRRTRLILLDHLDGAIERVMAS